MIQTDLGAYIKPALGNPPLNAAAGTRNGAGIDRLGFDSCVLYARAGAEEGAPSARTFDAKLQDSDTSGGTYADITGAAIVQITAVNTEKEVNVNLRGAKRFIRVVEVIGFTGGTSPKLNAQETIILGGAAELPAV